MLATKSQDPPTAFAASSVSHRPRAALFFQPKLTVNQPGDEYEREADTVADRVMRMTDTVPLGGMSIQRKTMPISPLQRKCAHCEREEERTAVSRKETGAGAASGQAAPPSVHSALSGTGQPLDGGTRQFMESRFGQDFSKVRVYTGAGAAESAQAIQARAYTSGRDIVFGASQYQPDTSEGKRLLAHELVHTVQQGGGHAAHVQRATSDFQISDLPASAAAETDRILFERGSDVIPASEATKISALAAPVAQNLTLHGFSSEDASAVDRTTRVTARLDAVDVALRAVGHTGDGTANSRVKVPHPNEGVGDVDYRHRRSVQVLPTPVGAVSAPTTVNPCGIAGSQVVSGAALTTCEASFTSAHPTALAAATAAKRDVVTTPTAAANALVAQFFAGVPRADVNRNVSAIEAQVRQLPTRHRCHTSCDGGCGRPAYNEGQGLGAAGAMMTLCPDFVTAGIDFRIKTLIHEASHGNPVMSVDDIAYSNTRLVPFLMPADAVRNTDSYVLLMRLVHAAGSMTPGPASPDTLVGMTSLGAGSDTEQSQRAIAWLESWLNYGDFDTEILYTTIANSLAAGAWVAADEFNIETMHRLATAFAPDLRDPGPDGSARTTPPIEADKLGVAAIHDRFDQMYDTVNHHALTITRAPAGGSESWGSQVALPRLTRVVTVAPTFFGLSQVDQVKHLVGLMVRARTDISSSFESKYVDAIDRIRIHRTLGP